MGSCDHAPDSKETAPPSGSPSPTWDLPAEIWLQVLRHLLVKRTEQQDGNALVVLQPLSDWTGRDSSNNRLSSQVLRTNRAFFQAGIELLYRENVFEMNGDDVWVLPNFLSRIGPNITRIRHLRLDHRNAGHEDCRGAPHRHPQDIVYVSGWIRDLWIDRLFECFPTLRSLETLSIAVDLPSRKMRDSVARMETGLYVEESGLAHELFVAKQMQDRVLWNKLHGQVLFYINKLGIWRAANSLDQWFPKLNANVYHGLGEHGAYGIFSTKDLEISSSPQKQRTAAHFLTVRRLQVDFAEEKVVEVQ
ncbi:hypothetical protein GJ744_005208 [Endocarpon pusillum]|uniref:Uncharacterized protein n=1 Tax=Endocarpon pusillum TaxID=364733 RepID=A0A8H7A8T0_9EURO|nr:hypothetical protein GJ744_005208 [Endocarpon pusillum]